MKSSFIFIIVYIISFIVAFISCSYLLHLNQWLVVLIGHLSATIVLFTASSIYNNSSFCDPFWSVAPIPIILYVSFWPESKILDYEKIFLFLMPVLFWGTRLTFNWARNWEGLSEEDFRYKDLKSYKFSKLIDLFAIHIYPTLQVNLSLFPVYFALSVSSNEANFFLYLSSLFTCMAIILEMTADKQLFEFKKDKANFRKFIQSGLWKHSRHPNYLGEILFWWGVFFMCISVSGKFWFLFVCPLTMNLMFTLKTCSMMDERNLKKRKGYDEYMKKTNQLIIWPF